MPIYEYRCEDCEQIFEEWQRDHKDREVPCPVCGCQSKRIISNTSFVLKGTGWYVTDYASGKASHGSASTDGAEGKKKETASDTGDSPKKADATPPAKSKDKAEAKTQSSSQQ